MNSKLRYIDNILTVRCFLFIITILIINSCATKPKGIQTKTSNVIKIGFGSCAKEFKPQPILYVADSLQFDFFVYLGDNIYGDTEDMQVLKNKYQTLRKKPEFQTLKKNTKLYATWDDHDYGENDAGRHYKFKEQSKAIFMDFWEVPQESERRKHQGIYGSEYFNYEGFIVQLILLDTRTFRDNLVLNEPKQSGFKNDYIPNQNADSTMLGGAQWKWLEKELKKKADFRLVASSNQFGHEYNGYESWTNVPKEQEKFLQLIRKTKANGVVFISGDVHWGEISKMKNPFTYPIFDVTSSGISEKWPTIEPNANRVGNVIPQNNIGCIEIFPNEENPRILLRLHDSKGFVNTQTIHLKDLKF